MDSRQPRNTALPRQPTVSKVAQLLGATEKEVERLAAEGRLGGVLVARLREQGTFVTPSVKNSIQLFVRRIEKERAEAVPKSQLDSSTTATIMFTDLVGSTALLERLGDRGAREVMVMHDEIIGGQIQASGGRMVKSMGDGFLIAFESARNGVACAVGVQKALDQYNREHPRVLLSVRIGLSVGEPIRDGGDLFGASVNIASRISDVATGGQVLVCQITHALVQRSREIDLRPIGSFELKGLAGVHPLYEVVWRT